MNLFGKRVLVAGLKTSGLSAYGLLKKLGATVAVYDDDEKIDSFDGAKNLKLYPSDLSEFDFIVVSPGFSDNHPLISEAKRKNIPLTTELAIGLSCLPCKKIAVTGTNGKTTTTLMIEKLLSLAGIKARACGNIGYPVSQLAQEKTLPDYAVVEVSSFQLDYGEISPDIAVVLNIAADHLDRYEGFDAYARSKMKIFEHQSPSSYSIINGYDENIRTRLKDIHGQLIRVSTRKDGGRAYLKDNYFFYNDKPLCSVKDLKAKGEHNRFNALVALTVGSIVGVPEVAAASFIKKFKLPPHRVEYVATVGGKGYYNDSKGTNLHATKAAIDMLDGNIGLIMGGSDKNEEFCDFFETLPDKVRCVAVTGANSEKIMNSAYKVGYFDIVMHKDLAGAVNTFSTDKKIDTVLFSPSSASFDRYRNYEERGNAFREMVLKVKA